MTQLNHLSLRYIRIREEDRQGKYMIDTIMVKEIIKIDIDQIVEIGEFHLVVKYNKDKIKEIDHGMITIIGMILEEKILKEI